MTRCLQVVSANLGKWDWSRERDLKLTVLLTGLNHFRQMEGLRCIDTRRNDGVGFISRRYFGRSYSKPMRHVEESSVTEIGENAVKKDGVLHQ